VRVAFGVAVGDNVTVGVDVGVGFGDDPHAVSQTTTNVNMRIRFNKVLDSFKPKCAAIVP
jgi:hypothetical protein